MFFGARVKDQFFAARKRGSYLKERTPRVGVKRSAVPRGSAFLERENGPAILGGGGKLLARMFDLDGGEGQ